MIVVLSIEGVLSEPGLPLSTAGPTLFGRRLYTTLHSAGESLVMLSTDQNRELVQDWLLREGFADYVKLLTREDSDLSPADWKLGCIKTIISHGQHIMYFVDNSPEIVSPVANLGIPMMLAVHSWNDPGRRDDDEEATYRSWDDLVGSIEAESLRRAKMKKRRRELTGEL